jgi:hypothetical protein
MTSEMHVCWHKATRLRTELRTNSYDKLPPVLNKASWHEVLRVEARLHILLSHMTGGMSGRHHVSAALNRASAPRNGLGGATAVAWGTAM